MRTSFGLLCMSITRQSPHIFRRSAAVRPGTPSGRRAWRPSASIARQRAEGLAAAHAATDGSTSCSTRGCLRALPPSASHRRGCSVIASSGQVLAHRPHCTQFFSMKRSCGLSGVVGQRACGAGADAAQAHRAACRCRRPEHAPKRRAGGRQRDLLRARRALLRQQVVERELERGCACRPGPRSVAGSRHASAPLRGAQARRRALPDRAGLDRCASASPA